MSQISTSVRCYHGTRAARTFASTLLAAFGAVAIPGTPWQLTKGLASPSPASLHAWAAAFVWEGNAPVPLDWLDLRAWKVQIVFFFILKIFCLKLRSLFFLLTVSINLIFHVKIILSPKIYVEYFFLKILTNARWILVTTFAATRLEALFACAEASGGLDRMAGAARSPLVCRAAETVAGANRGTAFALQVSTDGCAN